MAAAGSVAEPTALIEILDTSSVPIDISRYVNHVRDPGAGAVATFEYLIDEVKASVPIWKKEVYDNGEVWKENSDFLERRYGDTLGVTPPPAAAKDKISHCCGSKVRVGDEEAVGKS